MPPLPNQEFRLVMYFSTYQKWADQVSPDRVSHNKFDVFMLEITRHMRSDSGIKELDSERTDGLVFSILSELVLNYLFVLKHFAMVMLEIQTENFRTLVLKITQNSVIGYDFTFAYNVNNLYITLIIHFLLAILYLSIFNSTRKNEPLPI